MKYSERGAYTAIAASLALSLGACSAGKEIDSEFEQPVRELTERALESPYDIADPGTWSEENILRELDIHLVNLCTAPMTAEELDAYVREEQPMYDEYRRIAQGLISLSEHSTGFGVQFTNDTILPENVGDLRQFCDEYTGGANHK